MSPRVVVRPRPKPSPKPEVVDPAAAVTAELDRLVRAYRRAEGLDDEVGTNACLTDWAQGFAGRMATTGLFAHSVSPEWAGTDVVRADEACACEAPALRAEAIGFVRDGALERVAADVLAEWQAAWMHDEVLLDDFGTNRTLSFGAARGLSPVTPDGVRTDVWYVVAVVARDLP